MGWSLPARSLGSISAQVHFYENWRYDAYGNPYRKYSYTPSTLFSPDLSLNLTYFFIVNMFFAIEINLETELEPR